LRAHNHSRSTQHTHLGSRRHQPRSHPHQHTPFTRRGVLLCSETPAVRAHAVSESLQHCLQRQQSALRERETQLFQVLAGVPAEVPLQYQCLKLPLTCAHLSARIVPQAGGKRAACLPHQPLWRRWRAGPIPGSGPPAAPDCVLTCSSGWGSVAGAAGMAALALVQPGGGIGAVPWDAQTRRASGSWADSLNSPVQAKREEANRNRLKRNEIMLLFSMLTPRICAISSRPIVLMRLEMRGRRLGCGTIGCRRVTGEVLPRNTSSAIFGSHATIDALRDCERRGRFGVYAFTASLQLHLERIDAHTQRLHFLWYVVGDVDTCM
jgi:hypothetical protein